MTQATPAQIGLLHHTLGLDVRRREPWRNHFVAGPGHTDEADLEALVEAGLMERRSRPPFLEHDDVVYAVTDAGKIVAKRNLPEPPVLTRYEQYIESDTSHTFAEWLGIDAPRRENEHRRHGNVRFVSSRATGEWKSTVKEAKASYKAEMARIKAEAAARSSGSGRSAEQEGVSSSR